MEFWKIQVINSNVKIPDEKVQLTNLKEVALLVKVSSRFVRFPYILLCAWLLVFFFSEVALAYKLAEKRTTLKPGNRNLESETRIWNPESGIHKNHRKQVLQTCENYFA